MSETRIFGITVRFPHELDPRAVQNLTRTLSMVPSPHLGTIREIRVLPPLNFGTNPRYAGGGSGIGYPRLSELCFDKKENYPLNLTLLHEIGHIVDTHYRCFENMTPEQQAIMETVPIPTTAVTRHRNEHFAIAYQQFICGRASSTVSQVILASSAFDGVDTVHP